MHGEELEHEAEAVGVGGGAVEGARAADTEGSAQERFDVELLDGGEVSVGGGSWPD